MTMTAEQFDAIPVEWPDASRLEVIADLSAKIKRTARYSGETVFYMSDAILKLCCYEAHILEANRLAFRGIVMDTDL